MDAIKRLAMKRYWKNSGGKAWLPTTAQWNFDLQRQLPASVLLNVAYVGTRAVKFPSNLQLDTLPDSALALGNGLRTQVANPFYGQIGVGTLAASTTAEAQLIVPYPQFTGVTSAADNWANSDYHALQIKVEKRFSKGFSLLASYTYSKLMDYTTGVFGGETLGGGSVQDWNDLKAEYSPSSLDQTHRLIVNGIHNLPFFHAQQGFVGHVLGGWNLEWLLRSTVAVRWGSHLPSMGLSPRAAGSAPIGAAGIPALIIRPPTNGSTPRYSARLRLTSTGMRQNLRRRTQR
jgi:hypothetical protein